jgi:hypothetical protein
MMLEEVTHLLKIWGYLLKIWGTMGVNSKGPHSPHLVGVMLNTPIDHPHLQAQVIEVVLPHHNIVNQITCAATTKAETEPIQEGPVFHPDLAMMN